MEQIICAEWGYERRTVVPLEEYLAHTYEPDCESVDGQIVERNVGDYVHSLFQSLFVGHLGDLLRQDDCAYLVLTSARMRVRPGGDETRRYRIPDVMVVPVQDRPTRIIREPPLMVREILSPDDRPSDVVRKCADDETFGIPQIWVVDPESREVWTVREGVAPDMPGKTGSFVAAGQEVIVDLTEVFLSPGFVSLAGDFRCVLLSELSDS